MSRRERDKHDKPVGNKVAEILADLGIPMPSEELRARAVSGARSTPQEEREREHKKTTHQLCLDLGWPALALEYATNARSTEATRAVADWPGGAMSLVLSGGKGCGKTVAAAWYALHVRPMRFITAYDFARLSRFSDEMSAVLDARALCLDDLGHEYLDVKESFVSDVNALVDKMYSHKKPLIVTTNLTWRDLSERYGGRVADRLTECAVWSNVHTESLRKPPLTFDTTPPWEE